jgi:phytoene synthase
MLVVGCQIMMANRQRITDNQQRFIVEVLMDIPQGSLKRKTSFFLPLLLLPPAQRHALENLYRFCWAADDISDTPGSAPVKRRRLAEFKRNLKDCLSGKPRGPFWADFLETSRTFRLSPAHLWDIVKGVEMDLGEVRFKRFEDLHGYARLVAGAPGKAAMEIFGGKSPAHRLYAENLGVFLQITNITRDFLEDKAMGRRYFPQEDLKHYGVKEDAAAPGFAWTAFVRFQLNRALGYWREAQRALPRVDRAHLPTAEAIAAVYQVLHQRLKDHPEKILEGRVSLSLWDKGSATLGAAARCWYWRVKPPPGDCGC